MTIGFFGLNPGQSVQRNEMWPSLIGVLHDKSALAKRLAKASFGIPSTIEMHRLMVATLLWKAGAPCSKVIAKQIYIR